MKHIFIINPAAGKVDKTNEVTKMATILQEKYHCDVECLLTERPGHATELARNKAKTGEEMRIYACGGDGTINEVLNGVVGFDNVAMTCIPIGTGNDFLKNFGSDALERFANPEEYWNGPEQNLDVIECNGHYALTIACSGIDARIARDVHKYGESPVLSGKGSYVASLIVNFLFKGIGQHWTVSLDDEVIDGDFSLVAVCNGRYYGGGFTPILEAKMDDGILNTLVVKKASRLTFLRFVGPYSHGGYRKFPDYAKAYTAKVIRLHSDGEPICICLDGEIYNERDAAIQLSPHKLRFFGPEGCSANATYQNLETE